MKKLGKYGVAVIALALGMGLLFTAWNWLMVDDAVVKKPASKPHAPTVEVNGDTLGEEAEGVYDIDTSKVDEGVVTYESEVTDYYVQDMLNQMAHQKVEADDKWGAIEITDAGLKELKQEVEDNSIDLMYTDLYMDILNKWIAGDFSEADQDHNAILALQNGTIGEAHGLLSEEEEANFIEENFR